MFRKIFKNASWIIVCQLLQAILSFIIGMVSARYLGPSNYGLINYASSIVVFVTPIMQLGLRGTLVNELVSEPEKEGESLGTALVMCVCSAILCVFGVCVFVMLFNAGQTATHVVCILYSLCLIFQALEMMRFWFQAKLLSKYTSLVSLIAYVVVSAYKIYLLVARKSVYWFALSYAIDSLLISVFLLILYKKFNAQRLSFSFARGKEMLAKSRYYIVSGMMVTIFSLSDRIMLKHMISDAATGYYSAAVTCAGVTGFVYTAIIDSMRPVIFESKKQGSGDFEDQISCLTSIIFYVSLLQCIVTTVFASPMIHFLYGEAYAPSIQALQVVGWYVTFAYVGSVRNIWILSEDKQKYIWVLNLSGAAFNILLNLIFIPLWGVIGAAAASAITQFFTNFILGFIMKPIRRYNALMLRGMNPKFACSMIKKIRQYI